MKIAHYAPLIVFLMAQSLAAVWWAATINANLMTIKELHDNYGMRLLQLEKTQRQQEAKIAAMHKLLEEIRNDVRANNRYIRGNR